MAFRKFDSLTEPWWGRQPEESLAAYTRFCQYRELRRGERSYAHVADSSGVKPDTITHQAKAHRWQERAAAWDEEQTRQHEERIQGRAERVAEAELTAAEEILHLCRKSVRSAIERNDLLDPGEVPKWTESAIKLRQASQRAPEHTRAVYRTAYGETPNGAAQVTEIDVPEFRNLEPAAQRERVTEMLSAMKRLGDYEQRELANTDDNAGE